MLPSELPAFQAHIHRLIADGDVRQAIADLLEWTKGPRSGWHREVLLISADFEKTRHDESKGIVHFEQSRLAYNQINDRLLQLTGRLRETPPAPAYYLFQKYWKKVAAVPVALGLLAALAEVSGYTMRDFSGGAPDAPVSTDTLVKTTPAIQQITHETNSPAVTTQNGDVNINYGGDYAPQTAGKKPAKDTLK